MDTDTWFNGQLLKSIRNELGWTQRELALRANVCVRVIAKAEAGNCVSVRTTQALVQALVAVGKTVSHQDFVRDPRIIAQQFLHNCATFGIDAILKSRDLLAPSVEVRMDGDPITNPFAGTYRGLEEYEALLHKYYSVFTRDGGTLGDPSQMRLVGKEVIAWGHEFLRVPEAPPDLPCFMMIHMQMEDGLIARLTHYYDAPGLMSRIAAWAKAYPHAAWIKHFHLDALSKTQRWRLHLYHPNDPSEAHSHKPAEPEKLAD